MKYNEFKELVMASAKAHQLEAYELYYTESEGINAEALMHEISAFSTAMQAGACFRCIHDGKMGYAATEAFTAEEAQRIVEAAMENAAAIENNESALIHGAGDHYENIPNVVTTEPSASELIDLVLAVQDSAYRQDPRVIDGTQSVGVFSRSTVSLCNSKGLDLSYTRDYSMAGCFTAVKDGEDMFNGSKIKAADFTALHADAIAADAVEDGIASIGADTIDTGRYTIVFSDKMVCALMSTFFSAFSAQAAQRGISLLKDQEGEMVASPLVSIVDDPFYPGSLIQVPFDSEGVATRKKELIKNGQLITLLHNLTTAAKAGVCSTGNGQKMGYASPVGIMPYNFYMAAGDGGSNEDMFRTAIDGIYITELNGLHAGANPVSGDFSLAAAGFLIRNGEKNRPLKNFTISGNFYQVLKDISLVGSTLNFQTPRDNSCFGAPAILVKDMAVAGK